MRKKTGIPAKIASSNAAGRVLKLGEILQGLVPEPVAAVSVGVGLAMVSELRDWIRNRDERRIREFHTALLNSEVDPSGELSTEGSIETADFHALLAACLADIEEEKTAAYANLTRAIALGKVSKQHRRHFVFSLKDITWDYLDYLKRIYVVSENLVMPPEGIGNVNAEDLLTSYSAGSIEQLAVAYLSAKSLVDGVQISALGKAFVEACSAGDDLAPYAFGYDVWSGTTCQIVFLGSASDNGLSIIMPIEKRMRRLGIKSAPTILKGALQRAPWAHQAHLSLAKHLVITKDAALNSAEVDSLKSIVGKRGVLHVNVGSDGHRHPLLDKFMQIDDPIDGTKVDQIVQNFIG